MDSDGYLFFLDRKKDIIRKKGENISATEIESVINSNENVLISAVIAVPSELSEDEIMACVIRQEGAAMSPEEIVDHCRQHLAPYKVPRYIQFRSELPRTATERIAKYQLKEEKNILDSSYDMNGYHHL